MAGKLDEPEFWLPSEFLTDEDILMDNKENLVKSVGLCFPPEFPYDYGSSVLNSPGESVVGSPETESDEEDLLLTELTRQLTLHDSRKLTPSHQSHEKARILSGSPQSTLTQVGSWSGRSTMSSNGSPNGPSQVSSPPTTPSGVNNDAWELIFQAAGQVARLKMNGGGDGTARNPGLLGPTKRLPTPPPLGNPSSPSTFYHNQLKQEASGMWSRQVKNGWNYDSREVLQSMGYGSTMGACMGQAPCGGWPSRQQRNQQFGEVGTKVGGAGVYSGCGYGYGHGYGSSGVGVGGGGGGASCGVSLKKERAGTGVFLPRRYDNNNHTSSFKTSDARKKPVCSSAWVPNKVAQVSNKNLDLDNINGLVQPKLSRYNAGSNREFDALVARRTAFLAQQSRSLYPEGSISHEICLPQDWTY